jgi:hypothetical protein
MFFAPSLICKWLILIYSVSIVNILIHYSTREKELQNFRAVFVSRWVESTVRHGQLNRLIIHRRLWKERRLKKGRTVGSMSLLQYSTAGYHNVPLHPPAWRS